MIGGYKFQNCNHWVKIKNKNKNDSLVWIYCLNFKIMTGGYKFKNYDRWVKKKKKMTIELLDTN